MSAFLNSGKPQARVRGGGELTFAARFHARESLVVQETSGAQGFDQVALQLTDFEIPGDAHQQRAQVEFRLLAIEAAQGFDKRRRDDQHGVRVAVGVADEQAWAVGRRRWSHVQLKTEARQWAGQISW